MTAGTPAPDVWGLLQALVRAELAKVRFAELAVVTQAYPHASASDKLNYECDVKLRDSGLELKKVPVAASRVGLAAIPNVDDLVLVQFLRGDLHGPVITARLYNDVDRPPEAKERECVYVCPDDAEGGVRRAYFEFPDGNSLLFEDGQLVVDMAGTVITVKNGGDVEIVSKGKLVLRSDGDMSIESAGKIQIEAGGSLGLKAASDVKVEGLSIDAKAQTSAQLSGSATATLKGGAVTVAGTVNFSAA